MNKKAKLLKSLIKLGVIFGSAIVGCIVLYFATDDLSTSSENDKSEAERLLTQDRGRISDFNTQLEKSNLAEKRFLETQASRTNTEYNSDTDSLKEWLKSAISRYRFSSNLKLSLTSDVTGDNKLLNGTTYEAIEHPQMKMEFNAITDTHVFSFLDELTQNSPGFVMIEGLSMKRVADADKNVVTLLRSGATPYLMDIKVTFNWIGLREKVTKKPGQPESGGNK